VKLTTHLHVVPRSKNEWNHTSTPDTPSWRGALLRHRDNFTFYSLDSRLREPQEQIWARLRKISLPLPCRESNLCRIARREASRKVDKMDAKDLKISADQEQ
jgi:hypothetical protein